MSLGDRRRTAGRIQMNHFYGERVGPQTATQPPILLSADIFIDSGNVAHWQRSKRIDEIQAEKTAAFKPVNYALQHY